MPLLLQRSGRGGLALAHTLRPHLLIRPRLNDGHRRLVIGALVAVPPLPLAAGLVKLQLAALPLLNALALRAERWGPQ